MIDPFLIGAVLAGAAGVFGAAAILAGLRMRGGERWQAVADHLGLARHGKFLSGAVGGQRVEILSTPLGEVGRVVQGSWRLEITPETLSTVVKRAVGTGDPTIGDEGFDRVAFLGAAPVEPDSLALLSSEVRASVMTLLHNGGEVKNGEVRISLGASFEPEHVSQRFRIAVELASLLQRRIEMGLERALADLVENDPEPAVRYQALTHLVGKAFGDPDVRRARVKAVKDRSEKIRETAAWQLGRDDVEVLRDVYRTDAVPVVRAATVGRLAQLLSRDELVELVQDALEGPIEVRRTALSCVPPGPELVGPIERRILEGSVPKAELSSWADALGRTGAPEAQRTLLVLLDEEAPNLQTSVARALARVGDRAAVEKLLPWTRGVTTPVHVKDAVRAAIDAIQARIGGTQAGELAIADDAADGALSEPRNPGAVSIAKKQRT